MPKKRDTNGLEIGEEECKDPQEKSHSEWCLSILVWLFSCYVLFMDLYFDLIFKCFNLLYKNISIILIHHPHWGTGTVTLAFSFLEDVI